MNHTENSSRFLPPFAAATVFLSAWLLFLVQPIAVKQVMPVLGGSPLVWNTAMVFFQFFLLAGYMAAHCILKLRSGKAQLVAYVVFLLLGVAFLPFYMAEPGGIDAALHPFSWILASLAFSLSMPFLLLSMTNTLVQGWIARSSSPLGSKPYVLYAASNAGSLLALLSFFLLEYLYPLAELESLWTRLFLVLGPMMCVLALCIGVPRFVPGINTLPEDVSDAPGMKRYLEWIGLAFIPSGLFLSVTTYIATNIASVPLLWVIPLSIYLLTFILAFSEHGWGIGLALKWQVPFILCISLLLSLRQDFMQLLPVHLLALFAIALSCHGLLARGKPAPLHLSKFYLCVSVGGVLGGIFCSLIAPQLFDSPLEYPLLLLAACFARPDIWRIDDGRRRFRRDILYPLLIAVAIGIIFYALRHATSGTSFNPLFDRSVALTLLIAVTWLADLLYERKISFAIIVAAILLSSAFDPPKFEDDILYVKRNFFGVDTVYHFSDDALKVDLNIFRHGTTIHSIQSRNDKDRLSPSSYYWLVKPIYELLDPSLHDQPIALVGLGAGTSLCLGTQAHFDLFEINPDVVKIAEDPHLFTFMRDCGQNATVRLGDGRINLSHMPANHYGYIILDTFSSDAIPAHIITREALTMYLTKLKAGGIIALNISNQHFNLAPMVGAVAKSLSLEGYLVNRTKPAITKYELSSTWVVLSASFTPSQRQRIRDLGGRDLPVGHSAVWTDQYSNILPYLK